MPKSEKEETGVFIKNLNKTFWVDNISVDEDGARDKKSRGKGGCCGAGCGCAACCMEKKPKHAVRDVSIALNKGEVLGLLGANGAGKTTTFRMMCGVEVPNMDANTEILINGKSIFDERGACRRLIGYTAQ